MTEEMVVTGARIPSSEEAARQKVSRESETATSGDGLSRLKSAVRTQSRSAVLQFIGFPLKVRRAGQTRVYRSSAEVEEDFDLIFTPRVRSAILGLESGRLASRDHGRLLGNSTVWLSASCRDEACRSMEPVLIREINP